MILIIEISKRILSEVLGRYSINNQDNSRYYFIYILSARYFVKISMSVLHVLPYYTITVYVFGNYYNDSQYFILILTISLINSSKTCGCRDYLYDYIKKTLVFEYWIALWNHLSYNSFGKHMNYIHISYGVGTCCLNICKLIFCFWFGFSFCLKRLFIT